MRQELKHCKACNKQLKIFAAKKKCVNLGCIEYNVWIRRNNANKQKRYEKVIRKEEEE